MDKEIPLEIIKDRKEFQNNRIPKIEEEFELKKIVVEENKSGYDGVIAINPIDFSAKCGHHTVGINGKIYFAYIPNQYLIGLSQVARIFEYFLNVTKEIIQEEVTLDLSLFFNKYLKPQGSWIVVKARHECMSSRGVRQRNSKTSTSKITGKFMDIALRSEVMDVWRLE